MSIITTTTTVTVVEKTMDILPFGHYSMMRSVIGLSPICMMLLMHELSMKNVRFRDFDMVIRKKDDPTITDEFPLTRNELFRLPNFGKKTVENISAYLRSQGMHLKGEAP